MNLSEATRARIMIESIVLQGGKRIVDETEPTWRSNLVKIALFAVVGFAAYRFMNHSDDRDEDLHQLPIVCSSSSDVCPICLEPPRSGVRTGCGHRLCAGCLRSYCEIRRGRRNQPPPCPMCRTPLESVTLTIDVIDIPASDRSSDIADPGTVQWIRKFNAQRGVVENDTTGLFVTKTLTFLKLLLVSIILGIGVRFQSMSGADLVACTSFLVTAFGMILMGCLWIKCHEEAIPEEVDEH